VNYRDGDVCCRRSPQQLSQGRSQEFEKPCSKPWLTNTLATQFKFQSGASSGDQGRAGGGLRRFCSPFFTPEEACRNLTRAPPAGASIGRGALGRLDQLGGQGEPPMLLLTGLQGGLAKSSVWREPG